MLSDGPWFSSDFVMQFCMYMSGEFIQNDSYMQIAENQGRADRMFW